MLKIRFIGSWRTKSSHTTNRLFKFYWRPSQKIGCAATPWWNVLSGNLGGDPIVSCVHHSIAVLALTIRTCVIPIVFYSYGMSNFMCKGLIVRRNDKMQNIWIGYGFNYSLENFGSTYTNIIIQYHKNLPTRTFELEVCGCIAKRSHC